MKIGSLFSLTNLLMKTSHISSFDLSVAQMNTSTKSKASYILLQKLAIKMMHYSRHIKGTFTLFIFKVDLKSKIAVYYLQLTHLITIKFSFCRCSSVIIFLIRVQNDLWVQTKSPMRYYFPNLKCLKSGQLHLFFTVLYLIPLK